jgi:HSP20 family protein
MRSFFERLTGSIRVNDEEDDTRARRTEAQSGPSRVIRERKLDTDDRREAVLHPTSVDDSRGRAEAAREDADEGQLTVDIFDDGQNIVIQSTVSGVKPEDIDIALEDNTLTIRGSRKRSQEVSEDSFYYRELYWGGFSRSIILPEEVDFPKADAVIKHGLLTIKLPKKEKGARKIRVKSVE